MFRYFFALCFLAVVAISVNAEVEQTVNNVSEVENSNIEGKVVAKIIGKIAAGFTVSCILSYLIFYLCIFAATEHCVSYWKNPGKAISCAKDFFKANKGLCAVGK